MNAILTRALCVLAMLSALFTSFTYAHEGHDHGPAPSSPSAATLERGEAHSEKIEVVATLDGDTLRIFIDRYATNAPVDGATVDVETSAGPAKAEALGGGMYRLTGVPLPEEGPVNLIVSVALDGEVDLFPIEIVRTPPSEPSASKAASLSFWRELTPPMFGALLLVVFGSGVVFGAAATSMRRRRKQAAIAAALLLMLSVSPLLAHEGHDHGEAPPVSAAPQGDRASRTADGMIFVPKPVQRIFEVRTILTETARIARASELPGRVIPDPDASGYVQTSVGGRLSQPPRGFPQLGSRVEKGQVLGLVLPPIQAIDASDMRQRQGELDQQIAIVERRVKRFEQLAPSGAVAQATLEEARLELQGLRERRASIDLAKRQPEELIAPVAGVIADGTPIVGQIVQSNAVVFQIVDPSRLWVEALSFQPLAAKASASARSASGQTVSLAFKGAGLVTRNQSIPVRFAVEDNSGKLQSGEFVTVFAQAGQAIDGIAVPRSAVVRAANGQDFVYEHVSAERFAPRAVRIEPIDGENVLVASGLEAGRRVVVTGAELIDHVR
ncbi:MAG: efflux RND transporter periplasmic adaptor subunit [Xanthobacteraceae bacterium]